MKTGILELAIDADTCPEEDNIIMRDQCGSCKYYRGFLLYHGIPCIKCGYYLNDDVQSVNN